VADYASARSMRFRREAPRRDAPRPRCALPRLSVFGGCPPACSRAGWFRPCRAPLAAAASCATQGAGSADAGTTWRRGGSSGRGMRWSEQAPRPRAVRKGSGLLGVFARGVLNSLQTRRGMPIASSESGSWEQAW
jgi:hypothetical protein